MSFTALAPGEQFVMIRHGVFDFMLEHGLSPSAFTIYSVLAKHADYETGESFASRKLLAQHIGRKKPDTVDPYIRELQDVGLITHVQHRWTTQDRDRNDVVFTKDDRHPVQTSSLFTLSPVPTAFSQVTPVPGVAGGGTPVERVGVPPQNGYEQEPLTKNPGTKYEKRSVVVADRAAEPVDNPLSTAQARAWRDGEPTHEPHPIHSEWIPNGRHRTECDRLGLVLDIEADRFRAGFTATGERRDNWGAAFTAFLRDRAQARDTITFSGVDTDAADSATADHLLETYAALTAAEADSPASPLSNTPNGPEIDDQAAETAPVVDLAPALVEDLAETTSDAVDDLKDFFATAAHRQAESRITTALQQIDRRLLTRKMRPAERAAAEELLRAGIDPEEVRQRITADRRRVVLPVSA